MWKSLLMVMISYIDRNHNFTRCFASRESAWEPCCFTIRTSPFHDALHREGTREPCCFAIKVNSLKVVKKTINHQIVLLFFCLKFWLYYIVSHKQRLKFVDFFILIIYNLYNVIFFGEDRYDRWKSKDKIFLLS